MSVSTIEKLKTTLTMGFTSIVDTDIQCVKAKIQYTGWRMTFLYLDPAHDDLANR